ncbi:plexin-B2-like isoform X2 [Argonauta hians]
MDKILLFLTFLFIPRVSTFVPCTLKPLSGRWGENSQTMLAPFAKELQWATCNCFIKDCQPSILFSTDLQNFTTNSSEIFLWENNRLSRVTQNFTIPDNDTAIVVTHSLSLQLLEHIASIHFTDSAPTHTLSFAIIQQQQQFLFQQEPSWWYFVKKTDMSRDTVMVIHSDSLTPATAFTQMEFTETNTCVYRGVPHCMHCSNKKSVQVEPSHSIQSGHNMVKVTSRHNIKEAFLYSSSGCKPCLNITSGKPISCFVPEWSSIEEVTFVALSRNGAMLTSKFRYQEDPIITDVTGTNFYNWTNSEVNCVECQDAGRPVVFTGLHLTNVNRVSVLPTGLFRCDPPTIPTTTTTTIPTTTTTTTPSTTTTPTTATIPTSHTPSLTPTSTIRCHLTSYSSHGNATLLMDSLQYSFSFSVHDGPQLRAAKVTDLNCSTLQVQIVGERLDVAADIGDYNITVNRDWCRLTALQTEMVTCEVNTSCDGDTGNMYNVMVVLHHRTFRLLYQRPGSQSPGASHAAVCVVVAVVLLLAVLVLLVVARYLYRRMHTTAPNSDHIMQQYKQERIAAEEKCLIKMSECDVPFQKVTRYIEQILLIDKPARYRSLSGGKKLPFDIQDKLGHFEVLLKNKFFILNVIKAMEKKKNICHNENYELSLHLCLLLSFNLSFLLELCEELFKDLIFQTKEKERKKLMSRFQSISESILKNWMALAMYPYIKFQLEPLLYQLTTEVRQFLTEGAVDQVTGNSEHYFFKCYNISKPVTYRQISLQAIYQGRRYNFTALSCDSLSQLKNKYLVAYQAENINSELLSPNNIQIVLNDCVLTDYTDIVDTNGCTQMATVDTYRLRDGDQLYIEKVFTTSSKDIESRYVTLGSSVVVVEKKVNKAIHLVSGEKRHNVRLSDIGAMKLPSRIEEILLQLFSKMLEQAHQTPPLKYIHNYFVHQASKFALDCGGQWTVNSYVIQMCSQLIAHPNILLDIPMDECVQKNLTSLHLYIKDAILRPKAMSTKSCQVGRRVNSLVSQFVSQLNSQPELDKNDVIKSLQEASTQLSDGVTVYKEISLYYLLRIMENNYVVVYKALEQDETARKLCLHEKFASIIP